jgi:glycosyl transferase family 87
VRRAGKRTARRAAVVALALVSLGMSAANVAGTLSSGAPDYATIRAGAVVAAGGGDPYDQGQISRVELTDEPASGGVLPYVYPPNLTTLQLPFGRLPYSAALTLWALILLVAALLTVALAARVVWREPLSPTTLAVVMAIGLAFAPLRRGLELGQVDPLLALPAVAGLLLALRGRELRGGIALSALLLKPQLAAFPTAALAASGRARLVTGVAVGVGAQAVVVAALNGAGFRLDPVAWLHSVRSGDPHRPPVVATEAVALAVTVVALTMRRPLRGVENRSERLLILVALGAVLTALVGPWAKLNPQSDVLLLIPAAVVARDAIKAIGAGALTTGRSVVIGCAFGALLGDTLFAVTHYDGYGGAALAVVIVVLALAAAALASPRLTSACAAATVVNVALTAPMIPPGYDGVVSSTAAMLLALLICWPAGTRGEATAGEAQRDAAGRVALRSR